MLPFEHLRRCFAVDRLTGGDLPEAGRLLIRTSLHCDKQLVVWSITVDACAERRIVFFPKDIVKTAAFCEVPLSYAQR